MQYYNCSLIDDNVVQVDGFNKNDDVLYEIQKDIKNKMMYAMILHLSDLERAKSYLLNMIFSGEEKEHLVNEALFNSALVSFVKCFTFSKERPQLNVHKVYGNIDGGQPIPLFNYYKTRLCHNKWLIIRTII